MNAAADLKRQQLIDWHRATVAHLGDTSLSVETRAEIQAHADEIAAKIEALD